MHAGFEGTQLLQLLALLQRRRIERDEPRQRLSRVGIDADVMEQRAVTMRRAGAGEIERAAAIAADIPAHDRLHDIGIVAVGIVVDLGGKRGDIRARRGQRIDDRTDIGGIERRKIALQIHHHIVGVFAVDVLQRGVNPVGAGGKIGLGHDRAAAGGLDRLADLMLGGCDYDRADFRRHGPPPDPHDHGHARDIGQRFARHSSRSHARGYQDNGFHGEKPGIP